MTIAEQIRNQRAAARLKNPAARLLSCLVSAARLFRELQTLNDRQVGQLVFDYVMDVVPLLSPEMSICGEAARRLIAVEPTTSRTCSKCGSMMLFNVGIDEPDYWSCISSECSKEYA